MLEIIKRKDERERKNYQTNQQTNKDKKETKGVTSYSESVT